METYWLIGPDRDREMTNVEFAEGEQHGEENK